MSKAWAKVLSEAAAAKPNKKQDIAAALSRAQVYFQIGNVAEAQTLLKQILRKRPNHFAALHLLGLSEHQYGHSELAARSIKRAILVNPQSAEAHSDLGAIFLALQRFDEALASCDKALSLRPEFADAQYNRGNALLGLNRFDDALASFDATIAVNPHHMFAFSDRGIALHRLGRFRDAIASYDRAISLKPDCIGAIINRGCAFKELRQFDEAVANFDRAAALLPAHAGIWTNRGEALVALERLDEALASYDRALSIDPRMAGAWLGRANVLMLARKVSEALTACQNALNIEPNSARALTLFGQCHALQGDAETAVAWFNRALAIDPGDESTLSNKIFTADFSEKYDDAQRQQMRSEWWNRIGSKIAAQHPPHHANDPDPARRIIVGYVSADFKQHSAARAFRPVLKNHDKKQFEVVCYSACLREDAVTESFQQVADRWRNISQWSDDQLADCIRVDKVDILVDLSGHSGSNRLRVFARKPAPIQVTAWGHATGTGLPTIDYLFSDPVTLPTEVRHLFAEQIYDLPCALILEPPPAELRSEEPPALSNGYVTYGVFNRPSKFSDAAFVVWAQILQSDATARLLIKDPLIDDAAIKQLILDKFAAHRIASDRIDLMGATPREEHLAAYQQVDICLDPFPQNGGISTWEALYMGVPVVSRLGDTPPSRIASAILSAVGMDEWVAASDREYKDIALRSASKRLQDLRHNLPTLTAERAGPAAYTVAVETAYRTMWKKYCETHAI